jgi:SpoVK/Ycf46/Vps4 family AAA+-type ATPase
MDIQTDRNELFELELELPNEKLREIGERLIGFEERYTRLNRDMFLLSNPNEVEGWSQKFYNKKLPLCSVLLDRYPLIIFEGDVGTGKTATAECASERMARELRKPSMLFKMSTRVRGSGKVGQMSTLINQAFETIVREAGKAKHSFLIIDEADSLASSRDNTQSHHEDKVAVNTIIQKVDDIRKFGGRILVFLCTNRIDSLDPAVVRRAARIESFQRPNENEREALIRMDCDGLGLTNPDIGRLVALTGPTSNPPRVGFTFSDLRSKWLPEALNMAFPTRKVTIEDLVKAAQFVKPSPAIGGRE